MEGKKEKLLEMERKENPTNQIGSTFWEGYVAQAVIHFCGS